MVAHKFASGCPEIAGRGFLQALPGSDGVKIFPERHDFRLTRSWRRFRSGFDAFLRPLRRRSSVASSETAEFGCVAASSGGFAASQGRLTPGVLLGDQ